MNKDRVPIYKAFNPLTRDYDTFDEPAEVELPEGTSVIKLYWCAAMRQGQGGYVTVPGASLFRVTASGDLEQAE